MGQPPEDAIRSCLLATGLPRQMELGERDVGDVYYATLLQHVGCTAYAHETAALFGGNDIAVRAGGARIYFGDQREGVPFLLFELGKGATPLVRAQAVITAIREGQKIDEELFRSNCEVAVRMSQRLGLGAGVQRGLNEIYERWDGKGNPRKLVGDMALPGRFAQERPHRPALTPSTAAEQLSSEAAQGRLDAEAIRAVLEAAGHPLARTRLVWPAGLSDREVQVLRLVARGYSNREIARLLWISPKTAGHHVHLTQEQVEEVDRYDRENILPPLRQMDGFKGVIALLDRQSGKALSVTLWESEQPMRASEEDANRLRQEGAEAASET